MKLQVPIFKNVFSVFAIFFVWQTSLLADDVQEITNIVEVLRTVKNAQLSTNRGGTSGNTGGASGIVTPAGLVSQSPAVWSQPTVAPCSAPFQATPNALTGAIYSGQASQAINCQSGLQSINVGLTDTQGQNYLAFSFNTTGKRLKVLANNGLYVAINMYTNANVNYAQVALTNKNGVIFSQIIYQLPANVGFVYANVGFNMSDTLVTPVANQTYVNWVPINNQQRIWYQQNSGAITTPAIGGTVMSSQGKVQLSGQVTKLTPPTPPIAAAQSLIGFGRAADAFVTTGNSLPASMATLVDSRQQNQPLACQGGLQFINVGLIASDVMGGWWCQFNIAGSPILQSLAQQGLYVAVTTYQQSAQNIAAVSLTDSSGNIFAQSTIAIPAGQGFSWINIGYNKKTPLSPLKPAEIYVNWLPLASNTPVVSWYQDQGSATMKTSSSIPAATTGVNSQVTPPVANVITFDAPVWSSGSTCTAPFVAYSSGNSVYSLQNNQAICCSGGLQSINVGLTDQQAQSYLSYSFDLTDTKKDPAASLQKLAEQGLYVSFNMLTMNGQNFAQVVLTDANGIVYAESTSAALLQGCGFMYANVGFNMNNTLNTPANNQTFVNWFPISSKQRLWYQDQGASTTQTQPVGGIGGTSVPVPTQAGASQGVLSQNFSAGFRPGGIWG
jgi:hypothetical protein